MRVPIPLIGPSYQDESLPLSAQITQNLYPEISPEARNIVSLHSFPGLTLFSSETKKGRGLHVMNERLYTVQGSELVFIDSDGAASLRSPLDFIDGVDLCQFENNGKQMVIVAEGNAYLFTESSALMQKITDSDLHSPTTLAYLNAQFILDANRDEPSNGEFSTTQLLTTLSSVDFVNGLDFSNASAHPDDIIKVVDYNELIYFFGSRSIEPFENTGFGSPPFRRIAGGVRPYGLAGRNALDSSEEFIYFLDQRGIPRRMFGLTIENIGNSALGKAWRKYARIDNCVVLTYSINHQNFAQFNFPTPNQSWLYHENSNSWIKLAYSTNGRRHRANSYASVYGKNLVQDYENGNIYEFDPEQFRDDGEVIQRRRSTATIHGGLYDFPGRELFFDRVEFIIETGVGVTAGQGRDPQVMIRFSDDGGRTWSHEMWHPLGVGGAYQTIVELYCQGSSHNRIYELVYSEPTRFTLIEANADISIGI
jgi:hypothetical protein